MSDESKAEWSREQLQIAFASPNSGPVAERHGAAPEDPADADESLAIWERDTEPNLDAQMLRDALRLGLK